MRKLALCETQRIMSLPDDFKLTGKWEQKSERMGRMEASSDDEGYFCHIIYI